MQKHKDMTEQKPQNPFFTGTDIPDKYFCDRQKETSDIIRYIKNGSNSPESTPKTWKVEPDQARVCPRRNSPELQYLIC